jgi:hypothetical protein
MSLTGQHRVWVSYAFRGGYKGRGITAELTVVTVRKTAVGTSIAVYSCTRASHAATAADTAAVVLLAAAVNSSSSMQQSGCSACV